VTADSPGQLSSLLGRRIELALIGEFLDRAAVEGGALLLEGEPGVGKTALLRAAVDRAGAAGTRVVRAECVEFETTSVFAGLSQVLIPLSAGLDALIGVHRDALAVVLGLAEGEPPKPAQVANAALNLCRRALPSRTPKDPGRPRSPRIADLHENAFYRAPKFARFRHSYGTVRFRACRASWSGYAAYARAEPG
jgi:hypothetical protein